MALLIACALLAGLFQGYGAVLTPHLAEATYATGGNGLHRGSIDWFEWGAADAAIPSNGLTKVNTRTIAGRTVATTCRISSISGAGGLRAYRPGAWKGDGLDDLYNVGGTGTTNRLISGLANATEGSTVTFNFSCGVTLDGVSVPLQGLVVADAEQSDNQEYVEATPDQSGAVWRIIDRYRNIGCTQQTTARLTGNTLRLWGNDITTACDAGPVAVGFMEGATSAKVGLKGAGRSAIALGVMLSSNDYGDAPASYGEAGALLETTWQGGALASGNNKVSAESFVLATESQSVPRLGAIVDAEGAQLHSADATGDDDFGTPAENPVNDEDAVGLLGTIDVRAGGSYSLKNVTCKGPGFVAGWIDWNRNGVFDAGERSATVSCTGASVNLDWSVPTDTVRSIGKNLSFLRLRIARDSAQASSPTGMSTSGEVEDHKLNIALPTLSITKTSNATANSRPGDTIIWTVRATNVGKNGFTAAFPARLVDDLTGVLDDATYGNNAAVTKGGAPSYSSPRISWTGVLAVNETVELTYSTTLKAGGDGTLRNVAWEPNSATNQPTPACNAPVGGIDAASGESCVEWAVRLPKLSVTKTANQSTLPKKGTKVTYTVTVTNSGPGAYTATAPATALDDLVNVLDAATYDNNAVATVGVVTYAGSKLSWSGALPSGASAIITYTVTYTSAGDQSLVNSVCVPVLERLQGGLNGCASVEILGANLGTSKTVTTPDNPVKAGSVLTYTLRFENTGKSPATIEHDDILTGVLDDATVATPTAASGLIASREGDRIRITGSVPVNGIRTVTYKATVKPERERGDDLASNFLVATGAPPPNSCLPADTNCTSTRLPNVKAAKSVNPASGVAVIGGADLAYTLVITNSGKATGSVDFTDDLTDVLDDATVGAITATPAGVLTAVRSPGGLVRITGSLNAAQSVTLTYPVKVKPDSQRPSVPTAGLRKDFVGNRLAPTGAVNPVCGVGLVVCTDNPVSSWSLAKSATPATGQYVTPGDVVSYRVTASSTQGTIANAVVVDDLTGVLDNATFVAGSATLVIDGGAATAVPGPVGNVLSVGPFTIPAGRTAVLTYRVTVTNNAWSGELRNVIAGSASNAGTPFPPSACFAGHGAPGCSTLHPVKAHVFISKWGVGSDGARGPLDGSAFEVRIDAQGAPGAVAGTVVPVVGRVGRLEASAFTPGNYWLVETRAPGGYTLLAKPVAFTIASDGTLALAAGTRLARLDPDDPQNRTIRISDVAALPLPLSGGGAVNFVVLLMVMLGIGAFGVVLIRRQLPQRPLPTG
ncbi:hypothetical protein EAX62_06100 [Tessaracoccus antarcticus]|uniref:DUF11 domain-containing protein n=1 Tax=Tessaracoccus antarcticus TaxID=2479848 RepID=A0A3M0GAZ3_9ACTN|nr:hypothetical protein EAX62_06100 [Tessaracoccus antarcticus]